MLHERKFATPINKIRLATTVPTGLPSSDCILIAQAPMTEAAASRTNDRHVLEIVQKFLSYRQREMLIIPPITVNRQFLKHIHTFTIFGMSICSKDGIATTRIAPVRPSLSCVFNNSCPTCGLIFLDLTRMKKNVIMSIKIPKKIGVAKVTDATAKSRLLCDRRPTGRFDALKSFNGPAINGTKQKSPPSRQIVVSKEDEVIPPRKSLIF